MRKLGLGFLVTGVFRQLSALLWTYTSTGQTCQNNVDNSHIQQKVTKFEQLFDDLELPVARKENNFVVIGPYKQKQDAARVVKELSERHGVRGWMMAGN